MRVKAKAGIHPVTLVLHSLAFVFFVLVCHAGYTVNKEPMPQVYVNNVPIEEVR